MTTRRWLAVSCSAWNRFVDVVSTVVAAILAAIVTLMLILYWLRWPVTLVALTWLVLMAFEVV